MPVGVDMFLTPAIGQSRFESHEARGIDCSCESITWQRSTAAPNTEMELTSRGGVSFRCLRCCRGAAARSSFPDR